MMDRAHASRGERSSPYHASRPKACGWSLDREVSRSRRAQFEEQARQDEAIEELICEHEREEDCAP